MFQFPQSLCLYLADAFAGEAEDLTDLFEGVIRLLADAEPHADDLLLTRGEGGKDLVDLFLQGYADEFVEGRGGFRVCYEIAELRFVVADRGLDGYRLVGDLHYLPDLFQGKAGLEGYLVEVRFPPEFLEEGDRHLCDLIHRLEDVNGDPYGTGIIGYRPRDRLPDPPGGVRRELVALLVVVFLGRLHKAHVPFLDQVKEGKTPVKVFFGYIDNKP